MSCFEGDTESVRVMLNHINRDMRYLLLHMTTTDGRSPLHIASYNDHAGVMKVIHESVTHTQWIELLSTPLPQYNQWIHNIDGYQRAVSGIAELRAAARVKSALQTENHSGM